MGGPVCAVYRVEKISDTQLTSLDSYLEEVSEEINRTKDSRSWSIRVARLPIDCWIEKVWEEPDNAEEAFDNLNLIPNPDAEFITLSCSVNGKLAHDILNKLAREICDLIGGGATKAEK